MAQIVMGAMVLLLCAACNSGNSGNSGKTSTAPKFDEPDAFFSLLDNYSSGTFLARTAAEIQAEADIVAIGRMVDVRNGTTHTYTASDVADTQAMVMDLEVSMVAKGSVHEGHLYYEQTRPPVVSLETFKANMPQFDLLVFLMPHGRMEFEGLEYVNPTAGYPDDVVARALVNPQGLLYEKDNRLVQPFASFSEDVQLYPTATRLEDVAQKIADSMK